MPTRQKQRTIKKQYYTPLSDVIRQRDLFELAIDESRDGKSGCGALNGGGHDAANTEKRQSVGSGSLAPIFFILAASQQVGDKRHLSLVLFTHSLRMAMTCPF